MCDVRAVLLDGNVLQTHLVVRALCDGGGSELCRADCIACNSVLQKETKEEAQRHHDVTHGIEDDRPLRISKPFDKRRSNLNSILMFTLYRK